MSASKLEQKAPTSNRRRSSTRAGRELVAGHTETPAQGAPAAYQRIGLAAFDDNPFTAALPPFPADDKALLGLLRSAPKYDPAERELPENLRLLSISGLKELYIPQARHLEAARAILLMVYSGYRARNPLTAFGRRLAHGHVAADNTMALLIAHSGQGKSTLLGRILNILGPMLINHGKFRDQPVFKRQLVTEEIVCNAGDTPKDLHSSILYGIDERCGSAYMQRDSNMRFSGHALKRIVTQAMKEFSIGLLSIDEAHHFRMRYKSDKQNLLDAIVGLRQNTGVPILLIGTPRAEGIFGSEFAAARRLCDTGTLELNRYLGSDDKEFVQFCAEMWEYQWVSQPIPLGTDEIETLWKCTQGVVGLMVALFAVAQRNAITLGVERVDAKLLEATYCDQFGPIHAAINALRSGRRQDLAQFDDLWEAHKALVESCLT